MTPTSAPIGLKLTEKQVVRYAKLDDWLIAKFVADWRTLRAARAALKAFVANKTAGGADADDAQ